MEGTVFAKKFLLYMQRLIVISREKRDALSLAHRRRKKKADDLRLRHAALTRLFSATLTFAYFLRTYFCDRVPLTESIAVDPTFDIFHEKKEP